MSIKTQKIIRFIPIVNFFVTTMMWMYWQWKSKYPVLDFIQQVVYMLIGIMITRIADKLAYRFLDGGLPLMIVNLCITYVQLLVISCVAVNAQEKIHKYIEEKNNVN